MDTLKVKMNVSLASDKWSIAPGDVRELDVELAHGWLEIGHASRIEGQKVDKRPLPAGVIYEGFGIFSVFGQKSYSKDAAIASLPKLTLLEEVGDLIEPGPVPTNDSPADTGADNASRGKKASKG